MSEVAEERFTGIPLRVLAVNDDDRGVDALSQIGNVHRFNVTNGPLPEVGQVILLGDTSWRAAPPNFFKVQNSIAVVRRLEPDGSFLIDNGIALKRIENHRKIVVSVNNTVEFNDFEGLVAVVSESPISLRDTEITEGDLRREYLVEKAGSGPKFEDFGGYPHVISRARELITTQFENRGRLLSIGAKPIKGILFTGSPGTGKTYLARIVANETDADFYLISGPSIVSKWVGDTEARLRKLFEAAARSQSGRAIIFFDEIDSIAERRTEDSHEASKRLVAQLLTLMDGFKNEQNIVVIASTNRVDSLDPALTRPGRFDWEIEFGKPTFEDRLSILQVGARRLQTTGDLPLEDVAEQSVGWSAAELTALWSEAALMAASDGRDKINSEDVAIAFERVSLRPRREIAIEEAR
ncbi:ATP-binding protein [Rhizobium sp. YS-1r]|uniref:ATP-binding protein n=1 Tax=Rhizobium sp. YS-1r TaxID=1532558 RepID=UPI00050EAD5F|nr:ATP-binding protein [Rhizobium sp. YS-1r]KGD87648.1 ATP-dependent 26S proteasome regulatory subunit [Rhizobium sp. YS-1r]